MRFVNANRPTEILVYGFRPRFRPLFLVGLNDLGEKKISVHISSILKNSEDHFFPAFKGKNTKNF